VAGCQENERNNQDVTRVRNIGKMITPKRLVRAAFESSDMPRLPFIPWVFTHAARLEQMPLRRIYADPTQYTKCLQNAQKLYGYDAIIGSFDSSLEMEICGYPVNWRGDYEAPAISPNPGFDFALLKDINVENAGKTGRFGTVIESLRRINRVAGQNLALAAVVTGPLTLMSGLTTRDPVKDLIEGPGDVTKSIEAIAEFLLKVVQVYCMLELDIIAIADRLMADFLSGHLPWLKSIFAPILNTIRFYNAFSVLLPGELSPDSLANLLDLGFDGIVATGTEMTTWQEIKGGRSCVLGQAIPARLLNSMPNELQDYIESQLKENAKSGVFLTTDWEVPLEMPPDNMHLVMNTIF
jgi:uroporphyrinogen-III decarboxylase